MVEAGSFTITPAVAEDAAFIAKATLLAERAHVSVGMWDVYFKGESEETMLKCLEECAATVEESHLHFRHFLLARSKKDGRAVSTCSSYVAPTSVIRTFDCLKDVTFRLIQWNEKRCKMARNSVEFLCCPEPWPALDIYSGSCFLETMYTESSFRGQGVASALLQRHIDKNREAGAARAFLMCAIGNEGALRMYNRLQLLQVGRHCHSDTPHLLGVEGFYVLVREFPENSAKHKSDGVLVLP